MDAGNFSGDSGEAGHLNTDTLIEAMSRLGYATVNLAEREILFAYDPSQRKLGKATFPVVSANLVFQDTAGTVTQPFAVKTVEVATGGKKSKFRLGILGLARPNPGLAQKTPDGRRIVTADPVEAAKKVVPELRKKSDLVIALVTLEPDQSRGLAKDVPGIDLILGGFGAVQTPTNDSPGDTLVGETRILYAGNQGRRLGEVRVFLEEGKPARTVRNLITLDRTVPDDPAIMDLVEKNRVAINEINRKQAPLVDMEKLRAIYPGVSFVRAETCKGCHEAEYDVWQGTAHAHAFQILVDKHQDYNPDCVRCHTTGYQQQTGFLNARSTPEMMNVQCEACHGPGKDHPEKVGKGYGASAGTPACLTCHTTENSPDFDASAYMLKIKHWKAEGEAGAASSVGR